LSVEKEPRRFLTPQHKFIERPEDSPASGGLRAGFGIWCFLKFARCFAN